MFAIFACYSLLCSWQIPLCNICSTNWKLYVWCRFGYDYGGGYDREMGARPGYGEERPHGRYMGRGGGYQGGPPGTAQLLLMALF